jgi:hypothetical protein
MRYTTYLLVLVLLVTAAVHGADKIPAEEFAHLEAFAGMTISPDGKYVAYVESVKETQVIVIRDLDSGKDVRLELPASRVPWIPQQTQIAWINSHRLIYSLFEGGFSAVEWDGSNRKGLTGYDGALERQEQVQRWSKHVLHFFRDEDEDQVLMTEYNQPYAGYDGQWVSLTHPNVIRVNTRTAFITRVLENAGHVEYWLLDNNGVVRVGLESRRGIARTIHRPNEKAPWARYAAGKIWRSADRP